MKSSLLNSIICPKCAQEFVLKAKKALKNEVFEGELVCLKKHRFKISNGIPRLVVDKEKFFIKTEDSFSAKWKKYTKGYQGKKWIDTQKKWFLERFGWKNSKTFEKFLDSRSRILDAGTGIGNSAKLFSTNLNAEIFAIDASESVDFAYKKYGRQKNVHFLQADIRQLPFKQNFFDFICSDQVLHHTKDTRTSFLKLSKLLSKKGLISIYVYNKKSPMREYADNYIREITTKMSKNDCIKFSKDMADLGKSLSKLNKKITIPRDIPILGIKKGTFDVQRFIYWNFLKCWWSKDVPFEQSIATNFDWYFPEYAYRHTPEEVKTWFKESKLKITYFNEIESGISVNAVKK